MSLDRGCFFFNFPRPPGRRRAFRPPPPPPPPPPPTPARACPPTPPTPGAVVPPPPSRIGPSALLRRFRTPPTRPAPAQTTATTRTMGNPHRHACAASVEALCLRGRWSFSASPSTAGSVSAVVNPSGSPRTSSSPVTWRPRRGRNGRSGQQPRLTPDHQLDARTGPGLSGRRPTPPVAAPRAVHSSIRSEGGLHRGRVGP